ncbi:MAG: transposase [Bradymonadia bacterium]|jgi:transposase
MQLPEHIRAKIAELDPAAQTVIELVMHMHDEQMQRLAELEEQNRKYQQMLFGSRSEKLPPISDAVRRQIEEEEFAAGILNIPANATDDGEGDDDPDPPGGGGGAAATKTLSAEQRTKHRRKQGREHSKKARKTRNEALSKLPVTRRTIAVAPDALPSGMTRDDFYELEKPRAVRRIVHVREHLEVIAYELQTLRSKSDEEVFVRAEAPPSVIEGGLWDASVYAHVIVSKCVDSLPLYRQERILGRAGFGIARSVLCNLFHRGASLLEPIYQRLLKLAGQRPYVHADETKLRVAETKNAHNGWIWTLVSEDIVAYIFSETRAGETANMLLSGTAGVLMVDGYAGYNGVVGEGGRTRAGCWAHARRKFWDALNTAPEARQVLDLITNLYRVEHGVATKGGLGTEVHQQARTDISTNIVNTIEAWVDERKDVVIPKSPIGKAVTFAVNQRPALRTFLDDPKIPLDNNVAERALRVIAIGRKNYLFVRSAETGRNLAILQTICHTCLLHDINPYEYLQDILVRVGEHPASRLDELLPEAWANRHEVGETCQLAAC